MYTVSNQEPHSRLLRFLSENRHRTGAKVLKALLAEPGKPLSVMDIAFRVFHHDRSPLELESIAKNAFRPIPLADGRARAACLERLKRLRAQKKAGDEGAEREIRFLTRELRRITTPCGAIKNEYPEMRKAYHCFKMALNRLTARAEPEIADYIRGRLKTGLWCCWQIRG